MSKNIAYIVLIIITCIVVGYGIVSKIIPINNVVRIRAVTTTSLYLTGLLDYLEDKFREQYPDVYIDFIAVGSGEALRRASNGDACLVLVHAPSLEIDYISKGVLVYGKIFAYNYFVIVGPINDPANVSVASNVYEAFKRIYNAGEDGKALFVSRGDNSGTHVKEMSIWEKIGLDPRGRSWYIETGSDMAKTLLITNEKRGYTLSDIGTFFKLKKEGRIPYIEVLYTNRTELINIYSVYITYSCSDVEREYAKAFIEFLVGEKGQELVRTFGVNEYGQPLFYPASNKLEWLREVWRDLARK